MYSYGCRYCGKQPESCICSRIKSALTQGLGSHYAAEELMNWVVEVAESAARRSGGSSHRKRK